MRGMLWAAGVAASLVAMPCAVNAQPPNTDSVAAAQALRDEIEQLRRDFDARLSALEQRLVAAMRRAAPRQPGRRPSRPRRPPPPATARRCRRAPKAPAGRAARCRSTATPSAASKIFNPDIAVIGDFLGAAGTNTRQSRARRCEMHESEASFQAIVDPYARADFFIAFGEEGVELEEGFLTFPSLPGGLLMKVGKMRAAFGKVNTLHNHVLPWTDRPLVINNLVGGEEGIGDAGISVARLIPESVALPRSDRPGVSRRLGRPLPVEQARRPELRRPPARLSGHHREHQHRPRRLVRARPQRRPASSTASTSGGSRPSSSASMPPSAGGRCSARSTTRSSAAPS